MNRTELLELIDTKMNKLFNEYQKSNNIQYGDISSEEWRNELCLITYAQDII